MRALLTKYSPLGNDDDSGDGDNDDNDDNDDDNDDNGDDDDDNDDDGDDDRCMTVVGWDDLSGSPH